MQQSRKDLAVGIFDSGVGGLSILAAIKKELTTEQIIYFADQAHVPYGERPLKEVKNLSSKITQFLISEGAKIIVVACNTASAAALRDLRSQFPDIPFIGMEPAVKPASEYTKTGLIAVLATPATFQGKLYASLIEKYANNITVLQDTCPGLVKQIEKGELNSQITRTILQNALTPMLERGADTVVLGCTHYPFVIPVIRKITGPQVNIIDPSNAIARQTKNILRERNLLRNLDDYPSIDNREDYIQIYTSGDKDELKILIPNFISYKHLIHQTEWVNNKIKKITLFNK